MVMKNFFHNDTFYSELEHLIEDYEWSDEDILNLEEDFKIEATSTSVEPIFKLSPDWVTERIPEERFSEQGIDNEINKIHFILKEIDFEKINKAIPKLYYESRDCFYITKKDILDYIK